MSTTLSCNHQTAQTSEAAYNFILNHAYPMRWYENRLLPITLAFILGFGLIQLQKAFIPSPRLGLSILGLVAEIFGFVGDTYFTHTAMRLKPEFDQRGLHFPITEAAWLLPEHPNVKDLLFSWNTLLTLVFWPLAFWVPPFGIGLFFIRTCAMATSIRQAHRLRKTLRLIDRKAAAPHSPIDPGQLAAL